MAETEFARSIPAASFPPSQAQARPAAQAQFSSATGLATDAADNVYVADLNNNRIRQISPNGNITTVAGNGQQGLSGDNGPATAATLTLPQGVATDAAGNLYIADTLNHAIRKVTPTGTITTVAGGKQG